METIKSISKTEPYILQISLYHSLRQLYNLLEAACAPHSMDPVIEVNLKFRSFSSLILSSIIFILLNNLVFTIENIYFSIFLFACFSTCTDKILSKFNLKSLIIPLSYSFALLYPNPII